MVKIRGFSVVPGAVEATVLRVVAASACVVRATDVAEGSSGSIVFLLLLLLLLMQAC
jgi:hypothetical protein